MFPAASFRLEIVPECGSSQELVLAQRGNKNFHGAALLALRQTAGYGRRGRDWYSGEGNLALSLGLELPAPAAGLSLLPFVAGLAVHRAAVDALPPGADLRLKWPNDLYLDGKKLSGLIAQARQSASGSEVVVGVGVNLAQVPPGMENEAIALAVYGEAPAPEAFARKFLGELEKILATAKDFSAIRDAWESAARLSAGPVYVVGERDALQARALLPTGELLVEEADGRERKLSSEDVSLRFSKSPSP